MAQKKIIHNKFFDLIAFIFSFILSFFRSIKLLVLPKRRIKKQNILFQTLQFIIVTWPKYFWKKPTFYKIFSFP
jgi:hypothetical protein